MKEECSLLHDNAGGHVVAPVQTYLKTLNWEVLPHASYSPGIAPSDYPFLLSISHDLSEQHFTSYEYTKNGRFVVSVLPTR
ncbi:mariner Mos1 transposase [Trichonephila clavipes]|nr:mariner Mos1 transposase [Trichonephila clavipes]